MKVLGTCSNLTFNENRIAIRIQDTREQEEWQNQAQNKLGQSQACLDPEPGCDSSASVSEKYQQEISGSEFNAGCSEGRLVEVFCCDEGRMIER